MAFPNRTKPRCVPALRKTCRAGSFPRRLYPESPWVRPSSSLRLNHRNIGDGGLASLVATSRSRDQSRINRRVQSQTRAIRARLGHDHWYAHGTRLYLRGWSQAPSCGLGAGEMGGFEMCTHQAAIVENEGTERTISTIGVWPSLQQATHATKYQMVGRIRVGRLLPL